MSTLFREMTKTVPSLFRGIFSERNFDGNPSSRVYSKKYFRFDITNIEPKLVSARSQQDLCLCCCTRVSKQRVSVLRYNRNNQSPAETDRNKKTGEI
jgi:hypothetical protein